MRRRVLPGGMPPPTKSELKRQARAVQALADRLIDAPPDLVAEIDLPEKLADAIAAARRIARPAALARQRQFVAKLMRGLDLEPIRTALDADAERARQDAARFRRAERWRDRLVVAGEPAIVEFLAECPSADRATLERLVASAHSASERAGAAQAGRELFRRIRQWLESA
jgi:ribosome-associated protein